MFLLALSKFDNIEAIQPQSTDKGKEVLQGVAQQNSLRFDEIEKQGSEVSKKLTQLYEFLIIFLITVTTSDVI